MILQCLARVRTYCSAARRVEIMKYLCVAEKPSAASTIAGMLSRGSSQRREGFSPYNKIFEFEMDLRGQKTKMVFTSVSGHLQTHEFSASFRQWSSCSPIQLFEAPVVKQVPQNSEKIKQTLEREIRSCNGLIIWTDCDREGENIGYEIINVCRAVKYNITVLRAKFSDMTSTSVHRAINNLIEPDLRASQAVDVRSELDLRTGAAFTRFQTLRYRGVFPDDVKELMSYGSCQIPTLGFVVQRYKEIENFIPQTFWKIKLNHRIAKLTVEFNWVRNRLFDKPFTIALLDLCKAAEQAEIISVQQKPKSKWRPQPMDTIELEKTGSRKLKLSAKTIMTIAEKLYTQGFISYPRTETNKFPKEMNLRSLVEQHVQHPDWGEFAQRVVEWGTNPRNGNKSDQAHPPIHPTKFTTTLQGDERRVYELVVRHFLACVSKDAVGSETVVTATMGNEEFVATGLIILERNYLDVYIYDRWTGKEIHNYQVGEKFKPTELGLHEGSTQPPSLLTEADLIALMDKHGIGTDATHAEHINTIKERDYIGVIENGHLVPTVLGMGIIEGYELMNLQLSQPKLRAGFEEDLKLICEGRKDPQAVLAEQIRKYKECYEIITREVAKMDQALGARFGKQPLAVAQVEIPITVELFKCPKCRTSSMVLRRKKDNSPMISCQGYPGCRNVIWLPNDVKEITSIDETCGNCRAGNKKIKLKFTSVHMLSHVDEVPAFSKIEGLHYVTCLVCDAKLRRFLNISTENVKVLGNIVDAGSRPVHSSTSNPPVRNFSTGTNPSAALPRNPPNPPDQPRRGWYNDDDDDDRPSGGGGAIASVSNNQEWNQNSNNQSWNSGAPAGSSAGGSSWNRNPSNNSWNNNNTSNGWQPSSASGARRGWNDDNDPRPSGGWNGNQTNNAPPAKKINLSKLPNLNCDCRKQANKNIVSKEGANKGRPFYTCGDRVCKFFKWGDEPGLASNGGNQDTGNRVRRKCGVCKQEGHNRKNCPSAGNS